MIERGAPVSSQASSGNEMRFEPNNGKQGATSKRAAGNVMPPTLTILIDQSTGMRFASGDMGQTRRVMVQCGISARLTRGIVKDILTRSSFHPHGIKVRLVSGDVGRVQEVFE